jgi:hypothetical protein
MVFLNREGIHSLSIPKVKESNISLMHTGQYEDFLAFRIVYPLKFPNEVKWFSVNYSLEFLESNFGSVERLGGRDFGGKALVVKFSAKNWQQ